MKLNNLMSCTSYALSFNIPSPKLLIPFIDCATNVLHCPNSDRTPIELRKADGTGRRLRSERRKGYTAATLFASSCPVLRSLRTRAR